MPEVIQYWLGAKLGVLLDMAPEKFGRNTKDGTLLARLLYSYGVLPGPILNNVKESKNFYECYNNLVMLKPWLRYIGVSHDDCTLRQMAGGEGSASISVFYAVYLNLERKDRLHYFSSQKERKIPQNTYQKFKINWVPERFVRPREDKRSVRLSNLLYENSELIQWHKEKCQKVVEQIKKTKARFQKLNEKKKDLGPVLSKDATTRPLDKTQAEAEEARKEINDFEKRHDQESPDLNFSELVELQNLYELQPCFMPNKAEARNIVNSIKHRKKGELYARSFQRRMQTMLLDEQWKEVVEKQDRDFESAVCAKLIKQSQYEKQMMKRLHLLRNQKRVFAENRRKIECLKIEERQRDYEEGGLGNADQGEEDFWAGEFEKERIAELHRRMYDQKARARRAFIRAECLKVCEALVDIAIRISEARELIGCQVPKAFMKDLLELFFKDLPIFDVLDHFEELYDQESQRNLSETNEWGEEEQGGVIFYQSSEYERLKKEEMNRQMVLDDCDLNDYLHLLGPWMVELLFPDGSETEPKNLVLGYIVHKILAIKYPPPNAAVVVDVKPMKPKSIVQGLEEENARNMLKGLMDACNIMVVRVDDAVNFVLAAYKEEISEVEDFYGTFKRATDDALKRKTVGKDKEVKKKIPLLKGASSEKEEEGSQCEPFADKETQTPKVMPDGNSPLSPNADLGKQAFEALGVGDPVPDAVLIPALVAYVASKQDDHVGWVLLNYPNLYTQASDLEYLLTGLRTLPPIDQTEAAEGSDDYNYRSPWANLYSKDAFRESRVSRIVCNPVVSSISEEEVPKTYFDSFIKLRKVPDTPRHRSQDYEDFGLMEKYYFESKILFNFEYQTLNFQTIKNLGKAILGVVGEEDSELKPKTSVEIFGSAVLEMNEKWETKKKGAKDVGALKKVLNDTKAPIPTNVSEFADGELRDKDEKDGEGEEEEEEEEMMDREKMLPPASPGDPTWEWATGPQPKSFLVAQAGFWERLEAIYLEDFRNVFFCLRVHRYNLINYCGFLKKSLRIVMRKPDERQKVLSDFQKMFNEIDEDLRPDEDVKCELHVRVSELEQALMDLADERKKNSLRDTTRMAQDPWVPDEMATLVNTFLTAVQLEADRSIGSCQVIMDYYLSLQQKIPEEKPLAKVLVPKLHLQDSKYSISSTFSGKTDSIGSPKVYDTKRASKSQSEQNKPTQEKSSKTRSLGEKKKRNSDNNLLGAADFITNILINLSLPEDGLTPFHGFFMEHVQNVTAEVRNILEGYIMEVRKTDKMRPSTTRQTKPNRKNSITTDAPHSENLLAEWTYALENEISRFTFRTQLILARGIFEMNEFLTTILNILFLLTEEIVDMYLKEIQSISECCKVFRCAIEEEVQIRPQLELKDEEFIVRMDDQESPESEELADLAIEEERQRFRFTVDQLNILFDKLQRVAPNGEIIKRSLMYILEDLRVLKPEIENCGCFPEIWIDMEPDDIVTVINEVYQNLEVVHWKDFIIYALDYPSPTETEILTMRRLFRRHDPQVTELISRENYETVPFWFENFTKEKEIERATKAKDLLYRMYQVNALQTNYSALLLAFCKDHNPVLGFEKALALSLGKRIKYYGSAESFQGETHGFGYEAPNNDDDDDSDYRTDLSSSTVSMVATPKCIPKERVVRCQCKDDVEETLSEESSEGHEWGCNDKEMEGERSFYYSPGTLRRPSEASVVPYNILSSLLKASFPSLPQLSILLDCEQTFQETLTSIYDSLEPYDNGIDVHKLINHKFIKRLLYTTNKFKFVKLKPILMSVVKIRTPMPRVLCITDRPKYSNCLRK